MNKFFGRINFRIDTLFYLAERILKADRVPGNLILLYKIILWIKIRNYMKKITSFGEILFDVYPDGRKLGGAPFNFIYHIKKITGNGNFISRIGSDKNGDEIFWFMRSNLIPTSYVQIDNEHPTGAAYANLDDNKIPHWEIAADCAYDFIEPEEKIISLIENYTDCLYFGSLIQRNETSMQTLHSLFGKGKKYFCDLNIRQNFYSKEIIERSLMASNILKLNDGELRLLNELFIKRNADEISLAKAISENFELDLVCITQGEKGAIIYSCGKDDYQPASAENIVDTVGAGDAYAAILCVGYLEDLPIPLINKIATDFAGKIVGIQGALPNDDEIYVKYKEELLNE